MEIEKIRKRVTDLAGYSDLEQIPLYTRDIQGIQKRIQELTQQGIQINKEEALFEWDKSSYPGITRPLLWRSPPSTINFHLLLLFYDDATTNLLDYDITYPTSLLWRH